MEKILYTKKFDLSRFKISRLHRTNVEIILPSDIEKSSVPCHLFNVRLILFQLLFLTLSFGSGGRQVWEQKTHGRAPYYRNILLYATSKKGVCAIRRPLPGIVVGI